MMSDSLKQQKKYTKKVIITGEEALPEARAERLRRVRNMANLSRADMCDDGTLNPNTLKGWEIARYGGLPVDGAEKVVKRVVREGVIVTTDWLLHNKGQGPYVLPYHDTSVDIPDNITDSLDRIMREIMLFQNHYPNSLYTEITDDGMMPLYQLGDYVAGIQAQDKAIELLIGENCIIQTDDGNTLVRKIHSKDKKGRYTLICVNPSTKLNLPTIYSANIVTAAAITRQYKTPA